MTITSPSRWAVQGTTFGVWCLAAMSAAYWGLRLSGDAGGAPARPLPVGSVAVPDSTAIAQLLGAGASAAAPAGTAPVPALASRFALVGVAARASRSGVALISVDGKPPRPYRVGTEVEPGLLLLGVEARRASLGPARGAPATVTLELPRVRES